MKFTIRGPAFGICYRAPSRFNHHLAESCTAFWNDCISSHPNGNNPSSHKSNQHTNKNASQSNTNIKQWFSSRKTPPCSSLRQLYQQPPPLSAIHSRHATSSTSKPERKPSLKASTSSNLILSTTTGILSAVMSTESMNCTLSSFSMTVRFKTNSAYHDT